MKRERFTRFHFVKTYLQRCVQLHSVESGVGIKKVNIMSARTRYFIFGSRWAEIRVSHWQNI